MRTNQDHMDSWFFVNDKGNPIKRDRQWVEWISVEDALPEDEVILLHPFKRIDGTDEFIIFVGYLDEFEDVWICGWSGMLPPCKNNYTQSFIDKNFRLKKSDVTHWMKLPELPKGKDERVI